MGIFRRPGTVQSNNRCALSGGVKGTKSPGLACGFGAGFAVYHCRLGFRVWGLEFRAWVNTRSFPKTNVLQPIRL